MLTTVPDIFTLLHGYIYYVLNVSVRSTVLRSSSVKYWNQLVFDIIIEKQRGMAESCVGAYLSMLSKLRMCKEGSCV